MHLLGPIAALVLLFTNGVPSVFASPVEQSPNNRNELHSRASLIPSNMQCTNPAQINLINDPGISQLGSCGWKKWAACTALAAGVCLLPCAEGGLADPACDVCLGAMGALGCKSCIDGGDGGGGEYPPGQLWTWLMQDIVPLQPRIVQNLQSQYCDTPKLSVAAVTAPTNTATQLTASNSVTSVQTDTA